MQNEARLWLREITVGLNEPLKPVPQVFAADYQVCIANVDCTFAQHLHELMACNGRRSICKSLHHYAHKILQLFLQILQ